MNAIAEARIVAASTQRRDAGAQGAARAAAGRAAVIALQEIVRQPPQRHLRLLPGQGDEHVRPMDLPHHQRASSSVAAGGTKPNSAASFAFAPPLPFR